MTAMADGPIIGREYRKSMQVAEDDPLVSVIITVYNGEKYLAQAIESVLAQTYRHYELIVIDDGSTDNSREIIAGYGGALCAVDQENAGLAAALNRGITLTRGQWIGFLDQDDLWVEDKLTWQIEAIRSNPGARIVLGYVQLFISPELCGAARRRLRCPAEPVPGYSKIAVLARRDVFESVGMFSSEYTVGDFVDWFIRLREANIDVLMLPQVVAKRRLHGSHTTDRSPQSQKGYARMLKAALDRQRVIPERPR